MFAPRVSVIIPTFNRAALLPRAIASVRAQTFSDWEIILVDDGSTDDTPVMAKDWQRELGERFVYLHQTNAGSSAARNRGLEAARGEFISFLDSDDEYLPRKLERQLALFELRPELGLVYCDSSYINLSGVRHASVFDTKAPEARRVSYREIAPGLCVCDDRFFTHLLTDYFVSTISGMVRRERLERFPHSCSGSGRLSDAFAASEPNAAHKGRRYTKTGTALTDAIRFPVGCAYAEEWMFYLRVARVAPAGFVNEPLCLHHFTAGSLSRRDATANLTERLRLLYLMSEEFSSQGGRVRRILRKHLSHAHHQLAFSAHRRRKHGEAARHFARSFRFEPRLATLIGALQASLAGLSAIGTPSAGAGSCQP